MEKIYIALVDTPGIFAGMIRRTIKIDYIHVVISLDKQLNKAYSFGRRNPLIPFFSGFEKEDSKGILKAFPDAKYKIFSLPCTSEQKEQLQQELKHFYEHRFKFHYNILGLPFILMNKEFYQKNHYTCSSFIARILSQHDIQLFDKHFSLVTPKDFFELSHESVIYEGLLKDYVNDYDTRSIITSEIAYES